MADSLQNIKRHLRGVQNINQITKAMELVAATKMRRSQEIALSSRPYAFVALDLLATLSRIEDLPPIPLLERRMGGKTLFVLVTSDKGLAGSFNSAVVRNFEKYVAERNVDLRDSQYLFTAVGEKARAYLERSAGRVDYAFVRAGDYTTVAEVEPIASAMIQGYLDRRWDRAIVFSTIFRSALKQEPLRREILPVNFELLKETAREIVPERGRFAELVREHGISFFAEGKEPPEYLIEPSPEALLGELIPHLVLMEIYHLVLEANASEHAARRMAMKNASENASEIAGDLNLEYNKSRQASITREIIEVTSGAGALT